jgi:hypothetical protein
MDSQLPLSSAEAESSMDTAGPSAAAAAASLPAAAALAAAPAAPAAPAAAPSRTAEPRGSAKNFFTPAEDSEEEAVASSGAPRNPKHRFAVFFGYVGANYQGLQK